MARFTDKVVFITGAARGMGKVHAQGFHAEGAAVVIADVLESECWQLAEELGVRALPIVVDVAREDNWDTAVKAAEAAFGPISVLINNAGMLPARTTIDQSDVDVWRRTIDVNLVGAYLGIRAITPSLRRAGGGAIINISSISGLNAAAGRSAYNASKWGLRGLTRAAALELGRDNIRVNSVHPGAVDTAQLRRSGAPLTVAANFAIPRVAEPVEITRLVMFLASEDASFSTGAEFVADGGYLLGPALT